MSNEIMNPSIACMLLRDYHAELTTKQRAQIADVLDDWSECLSETSGELVSAQVKREEYALRLCAIYDQLKRDKVHIENDWCWCHPVQDSENHWIHN